MTQEEKAKAYDEALERAKKCLDENRDTCFVRPDVIFPELADKDEKIRKEIIDFICWATDRGSITKEQREKSNYWLAWLEKQGKQKPIPHTEDKTAIEASEGYRKCRESCGIKDPVMLNEIETAYYAGATLKRKPTKWSEEDERIIKRIDSLLYAINESAFEDIHVWIKSLKQRCAWKPSDENKKLTDVNHEYFSELLENNDSDDINDYAYQIAYCMSHDWATETPTWDDVQKACKLGAQWQKKHNVSKNWCEEDDNFFNDTITFLKNTKNALDHVDWIKSLKQRICG